MTLEGVEVAQAQRREERRPEAKVIGHQDEIVIVIVRGGQPFRVLAERLDQEAQPLHPDAATE